MKTPSEASLPPAIVAERERLIRWPHFKPEWWPILEHLCTPTIWNPLSKHKPIMTRAQLIETWSSGHQGAAPDEERTDRELALQIAFRCAFFFAISNMRTSTSTQEKKTVNFYRKKAKQFREDASRLAELNEEAAEYAHALAEWHEAWGDELNSPAMIPGLIARRHHKLSQVRAFCVLLGGLTRRLYGDVLRERVASIANAAFPREAVSKADVRYWCK